jgi:valyl-tRNA synthetase
VAKALLHTDQAPFSVMGISGWCLAHDRSKMSKSKGNTIDPLALLDQHGTDVVRYWAANSRLGNDTAFSEDVLKIGKRLVTKLRNAAKFCAPHLSGFDGQDALVWQDLNDGRIVWTADKWLLERLHEVVANATNHHAAYDYTDALEETERFFFADFCDNYLELVKGRIYGEVGDSAAKLSAQLTLGHALVAILHLFAPFMPFVTEEILHDTLPKTAKKLVSVHARGGWPKAQHYHHDAAILALGNTALEALAKVRGAKSERGVSIKAPLARVSVTAGIALPADLLDDLKHTVSAGILSAAHDKGAALDVKIEWPVSAAESHP